MIVLSVSCPVEMFAEITPSLVRFMGPVGTVMKQQVRVVPSGKISFKITGSSARDGKNIRFEVKEITESEQTGYLVEVENIKQDVGSYHDLIYLDTDNKIRPQLSIRVFGSINDPSLLKVKNDSPAKR